MQAFFCQGDCGVSHSTFYRLISGSYLKHQLSSLVMALLKTWGCSSTRSKKSFDGFTFASPSKYLACTHFLADVHTTHDLTSSESSRRLPSGAFLRSKLLMSTLTDPSALWRPVASGQKYSHHLKYTPCEASAKELCLMYLWKCPYFHFYFLFYLITSNGHFSKT